MNPSSKKIISSPSSPPKNDRSNDQRVDRQSQSDVAQEIISTIQGLKESEGKSLKDYPIRALVKHAEAFGPELKRQRLETNQVRKFLDAINQIKAKFPQIDEEVNHLSLTSEEKEKIRFAKIESDIVLLKPKLAYAAARQDAVKALNRVMAEAIDKVHSKADFDRLVQLMESIIAYHKAEGGK